MCEGERARERVCVRETERERVCEGEGEKVRERGRRRVRESV